MRAIAFAVLIALSALLTPVAQSPALPLNEPHNEAPTTQCDTYAASTFDPQRKATGVPADKINPALAVPACETAVRQYPNSIRLIFQLGRAYQKANNGSAALEQYRKASDQNYALAQFNLASMYASGQGVPQDYQQAVAWYRKAAEQGLSAAQWGLGSMYEYGQGVTQDYRQAVAWYRKAAEQGFAMAQYNLGNMYLNGFGVPKNETEAFAWFLRAAEQGNARAQGTLGFMYADGHGVAKDEQMGVTLLRKGAEGGDANAQFDLGLMYQNGRGVAVDYSQALRWYRKAAEQRNASAQLNLGVMYHNGMGVTKDDAQAVAWYRKAAALGNEQAKINLGPLMANAEINDKFQSAEKQGYQAMAFDDFKLDGKKLAGSNAKILMQGFYKKFGDVETLQPSGLAVAIVRERGNDNGIPLLTDDASRNVRKYLLQCGDDMRAPLGCQLTVIGHASMCTMTNLVGSKNVPCLVVEDGW